MYFWTNNRRRYTYIILRVMQSFSWLSILIFYLGLVHGIWKITVKNCYLKIIIQFTIIHFLSNIYSRFNDFFLILYGNVNLYFPYVSKYLILTLYIRIRGVCKIMSLKLNFFVKAPSYNYLWLSYLWS